MRTVLKGCSVKKVVNHCFEAWSLPEPWVLFSSASLEAGKPQGLSSLSPLQSWGYRQWRDSQPISYKLGSELVIIEQVLLATETSLQSPVLLPLHGKKG